MAMGDFFMIVIKEFDEVLRTRHSLRMKAKPLPPLEFLNECFDLNHETGQLFWVLERPIHHFKNMHGMHIHNSKFGGKEAGSIFKCSKGTGFRRGISIQGYGKLLTSRIVFFMTAGNPDPGLRQIDHIDGNSLNDAATNLRIATNQMNNANVGRKVYMGRERHLPKGVYPNGVGKWQAKIKVNYKTYCLGTYKSPEEASAAYGRAAEHHFGEYHRKD